jgi:hypothetical protein
LQPESRLLGLMAVSNEPSDQVDQEVDWATMAGMLDLADVFELIIDGLDDRPLAQEGFVRQREQAVVHLLAQFGDEMKPLGDQELLGERLGKVAFVCKEVAEELLDQLGNGSSIINVARRQAKGQQLSLVIDDQVQLEAIKPADRVLAACRPSGKHPMLVNAGVVADGKRSGVDQADPAAAAQLGVEVGLCWLLRISVLE